MSLRPYAVMQVSVLVLSAFAASPLFGADPTAERTTQETGFVPIFDGKSLDGWEGNSEAFRVENGAVVAGSLKVAIPQNEFLCTKKSYADFELRLEAKLEGAGENAGIQFRSQRVPNHHEVSGYQCDMGRAWDRSVWGALYDESRRNEMLVEPDAATAAKASRPAGEWNAFVIRCEGPRIRIWLNDVLTVDYVEPEAEIPRAGVIGLQIHGGKPALASYRNVRIQELTAKK